MPELSIDPDREYRRWRALHEANVVPRDFAYQWVEIRKQYARVVHPRERRWRTTDGWPTEQELVRALATGLPPDALVVVRKDVEKVRSKLDAGLRITAADLDAVVGMWSVNDVMEERILSRLLPPGSPRR